MRINPNRESIFIDDILLDKIGNYFVYHNIKRYMTFERFVDKYLNGTWQDVVG